MLESVDTALEVWRDVRLWFWDPVFWLPPNTTWAILDGSALPEGVVYPDFYELWIPFPMAVLLLTLRVIWERYAARNALLLYLIILCYNRA